MADKKKAEKKTTQYKITLQNGSGVMRDISNTDADELKVLKGKGYKIEEILYINRYSMAHSQF